MKRRALFLAAFLGGCGVDAAGPHWSLAAGGWQLYTAERQTQARSGVERLWVRNVGQVTPGDGPVRWLREFGTGSAELLAVDGRGLFRVAWLAVDDEGRGTLEPAETLLVPLAADRSVRWEAVDRTRLLERKVDGYGRLFVVNEATRLEWRVEAEEATVTVPAGRFVRCLRLVGRGGGRFEGDRSVTGSHFSIVETQWHAPGVGLVRLEREETTDGGIIPFGRYRLELIARGPD